MKINHPLVMKLGGLLGSIASSCWMRTLDYKIAYHDRRIDPIFPEFNRRRIYLFWHEYLLFPLAMRGHCNFAMLLSRHTDAEILSRAAYHRGFEFIRGSTGRGGTTALKEMLRKCRRMNLTITPDGPRGPRRRLAPGAIFLASRLGMPIVVFGLGYDRPWRFRKAWDQFAIPRPGSRARSVTSEEIFIPGNLKRAEIEQWRLFVENRLNELTEEAETWAESGRRRQDEEPLYRATAPTRNRRFYDEETREPDDRTTEIRHKAA